jgi:hypothetical protein
MVERFISNPKPSSSRDIDKRDLAAQEASATFAWWMVVISALGVIVTTIGTLLLFQQIRLTREAVKDTGRATDAMMESNRIAELAMTATVEGGKAAATQFERQIELQRQQLKAADEESYRRLRAYVILEAVQVAPDFREGILHGIAVSARVKNVGQTPGTVFEARSDGWLVPIGDPFPTANLVKKDDGKLHVTLGNTPDAQIFANIYYDRNELLKLSQKLHNLYVFTIIRYTDIFENEHEIVRASQIWFNGDVREFETQLNLGQAPQFNAGPISIRTVPNYGKST